MPRIQWARNRLTPPGDRYGRQPAQVLARQRGCRESVSLADCRGARMAGQHLDRRRQYAHGVEPEAEVMKGIQIK